MNVGAIERLERAAASGAQLDRLLAEESFPLVEGSRATFLFRGHADQVELRHWIYGLPSTVPFRRLAGSDAWVVTVELPAGSRVEYKLQVTNRGRSQLLQDPLNPNLARDPFGANSVVHGEGYAVPTWVDEDPEARRGELVESSIESAAFGDERPIRVYLPARFRRTRRYPLLVVHDGEDYLRFADLQTVLDNLVHRLEIPPMVTVLTQSDDRMREYADDPRHARFLVEELLPRIEADYPILPGPGARGLLGASLGAVAALSTAWRHPLVFGNLFLQSGSFAFTDIGDHDRGPAFDPVFDFVKAFRADPGVPAERVYLSCGVYESLIVDNRSLLPVLQSTGMQVRFEEARDGHNWENWRDRLRGGLSWLFPGPLWMVYE